MPIPYTRNADSAVSTQAADCASLETLDRKPAVLAGTGLSNTVLYDLIRKGEFPAPVSIGARSVAWRRSEWQAWVASRTSKRVAA